MDRKINYLDGLRGIAAFIVMVAHFLQVFYPTVYNGNISTVHTNNGIEMYLFNTPLNLLVNASFSVCIFFVLSGFVLSIKFFKTKNGEVIISSVARRYLRLAIPVCVTLLIAFTIHLVNGYYLSEMYNITGTTLMDRYQTKLSLFTVLEHSLYSVFFTNTETYNASLWTIKYEFLGSFLVFGTLSVIFALRNSKKRVWVYAVLILLTLNDYYLAFMLGVILADLIVNNQKIFSINKKVVYGLIIPIGLFFGSYPYGDTSNTIYSILNIPFLKVHYSIFYHIVGSYLILYSILTQKGLQRVFSTKTSIFLGKISFSLYLIHFLVINSLSCYLFKHLLPYISYNSAFMVTFLISSVVITSVSYVMYLYVDNGSVTVSQYVYKQIVSLTTKTTNRLKFTFIPATLKE